MSAFESTAAFPYADQEIQTIFVSGGIYFQLESFILVKALMKGACI